MKTNKRDAWINRLSYAWLLVFAGLGLVVLLHRSEASVARSRAVNSRTDVVGASKADTPMWRYGHRNIEDIRVGQRVLASNPQISDEERLTWEEPDWSQWRLAKLEMTKPDGGLLKIEMLRPLEWCVLQEAKSGAEIWLDLPEMGAEGLAQVKDLSDCPPIRSGPGQVVTATFAHPPSTAVLAVQFDGEPQPIGVTDNHLFWSVEREDFLPIGQMSVGDHVLTYSGDTKRIESKLPRPGPQLVYNLEVYGQRVYFVGQQGLLAHNNYAENLPVSRDQYGYRDAKGRFAEGSGAERLVIGRGADLAKPGALQPGEFTLRWKPTGTARSEWKVNSGLLREEMANMRPIRDASVGNLGGPYLNAERNLLKSRGWNFDQNTSLWMSPSQ